LLGDYILSVASRMPLAGNDARDATVVVDEPFRSQPHSG
jgi:hypothetical protein